MALRRVDDTVLDRVDKTQKDLKKICDSISETISVFSNASEYSPLLSILLPELKNLVDVVKENIDFTRNGFDLFISEIKGLDRRVEELEKKVASCKNAEKRP